MQSPKNTSQKALPLLFGVLLIGASVKFVWDQVQRSQAQKHAELGFIALTAKQYEIAIQEYRQAVALDPKNSPVYYNLGLAYYHNGDTGSAMAAYQKAIDLKPTDAIAYHQMGIAFMHLRKYDDAIPYFHRAIKLDPTYPLSHGALGSIYSEQGKTQEAIEEFQTVLTRDPDNPNAKRWLEKLQKPDSGKLVILNGDRLTQEYEAGFLKWHVEETPLGDWTQRIAGIVTWNEKSGAKGTPAVAMPVILLRVDPDKKRLEPIAQAITDEQGRFAFRAPIGIEISFGARVERAQNLPPTVQHALEKKEDGK